MLTALNLLLLGVASGILGLWGRALLLDLGIIRGFEAGLWACAVIATAYAASQLLFRALLMLIKPTRAISLDISEILAHLSVVVLLPPLVGIRFELPYETLQPLEPLIYFGVFAALLGVFRLMTFFAAIYGDRSGPAVTLRWAVYACASLALVPLSAYKYLDAVAVQRELISGEAVAFAVNNTYSNAYAIPENKRVIMPLEWGEGDRISLLCAPKPEDNDFPETVYVRVETYNKQVSARLSPDEAVSTGAVTRLVDLSEEGWTPVEIPYADFPADTQSITVTWTVQDPEGIRQRLGLLPTDSLGRIMMVSGPWPQQVSKTKSRPSVIVLLVEGMGAENMSLYGYERDTTPSLAKHAGGMIMCEEVYTPTPETRGAAMSLLTGLNPFSHRYYASSAGPLPGNVSSLAEVMQNHGYFTVAFTEGRGITQQDLVHGSGFEKGFILFDDYYPLQVRQAHAGTNGGPQRLVPAGAHVTLDKAAAWIEDHHDLQYFVFVRLRELSEPRYLLRYGKGFMRRVGTSSPLDIYDTAMAYMDRQMGVFLDRVNSLPADRQPIVVITSTNGFDFRAPGRGAWRRSGEAQRSLFESALRIPLLMRIPGKPGQTNKTPASLVDVAPTLAALTGASLPYHPEGANVLEDTRMREIISIMGDPVAQSMRSGRWRFTWQTGLSAQTLESVEKEAVTEFIDIARFRNAETVQDNVRREPDLVEAFKTQLSTALHESFFGNTVITMIPRSGSSL